MTWTRLHDAVQHHDYKEAVNIAHISSDEAMMVDDHGSTPLHLACWGNPPVEVIQALLKACPQAATDKDVIGNTPLHIASGYPGTDPNLIREILKVCPTAASLTNREGLMPLHVACRHACNNGRVISALIDAYPYALKARTRMGSLVPSKKKRNSETTTITTISNNSKDTTLHFVTDLAAGKSNLDSTDVMYWTLSNQIRDGSYPLHMAIQAGAPLNVVERILREDGDQALLQNKFGMTPLHVALSLSSINEDVIILLLVEDTEHRFTVSGIKDKQNGNLPLHIAAMTGCSVDVAKELLLLHPQSIHERNKQSKTPLDLAIEYSKCSDQVIRLLEISDDSESSP